MGLRVHWQMSEEIMHLSGSASDVKEWRAEKMRQGLRPREVAAAASQTAKTNKRKPKA